MSFYSYTGSALENGYDAPLRQQALAADNMFSDLVPTTSTPTPYTSPFVAKTPYAPVMNPIPVSSLPGYSAPTAPAPAPAPATATPAIVTSPATVAPATPATPAAPAPMSLTDFIRSTPGYAFQVQQGTDAINANAYARGMGNSGATLKALSDYGQKTADNYYQQYLNNVAQVAGSGQAAAGALAGVSQNYGNNSNAVTQGLATVIGNGAIANGNTTGNMYGNIAGNLSGLIGGLGQAGVFGTSYKG